MARHRKPQKANTALRAKRPNTNDSCFWLKHPWRPTLHPQPQTLDPQPKPLHPQQPLHRFHASDPVCLAMLCSHVRHIICDFGQLNLPMGAHLLKVRLAPAKISPTVLFQGGIPAHTRFTNVGRGSHGGLARVCDTVGNAHRAQVAQLELFELILLSNFL